MFPAKPLFLSIHKEVSPNEKQDVEHRKASEKKVATLVAPPRKINMRDQIRTILYDSNQQLTSWTDDLTRRVNSTTYGYRGISSEYVGKLLQAIGEKWAAPERYTAL